MSQENVEVVRASFEAWNAGDMDAFDELNHPDVVMRPPESWPEPGPYVGREAVSREFNQLRETFDVAAVEFVGKPIDIGDRVVARFNWHGEGRGPEANLEATAVFTVRKGKILSSEFFWDHTAALEAAGLSEQDAHADS